MRQYGFAGVDVQRRRSDLWSKRNLPVERYYPEDTRAQPPPLSPCASESDGDSLSSWSPSSRKPRGRRYSTSSSDSDGYSGPSYSASRSTLRDGPNSWHSVVSYEYDKIPDAFKPRTLIGSDESLRDMAATHLPRLLEERPLDIGHVNKVFASRWFDDSHVAFATKGNGLYVVDVNQRQASLLRVPNLSSPNTRFRFKSGGIHAMDVNPSGTLLATGAENPCDVAVYRLPAFAPLAVGDRAHHDWLFDLKWLDDRVLASGSRDSVLALFRFDENELRDHDATSPNIAYPSIKCTASRTMQHMDKIRALTFSRWHKLITLVSSDSTINTLDARTLRSIESRHLDSHMEECVCVCHDAWHERSVCIGARSSFVFLDTRTLAAVHDVELPLRFSMVDGTRVNMVTGVRSISWRGPIVTLGTGDGELMFFDVRMCNFLPCYSDSGANWLRISDGWLNEENEMARDALNGAPSTAVYTHSYDPSGTRLFAAGGPIAEPSIGNYAAVWG